MPTRDRGADTNTTAGVVLHDFGVRLPLALPHFASCFLPLPFAWSPFDFSRAISSRINEASQPINMKPRI